MKEFEWVEGDQKCRVEVKDGIGHYAEEVVYPDGTGWTDITWYDETEVKPIRALLSRDAEREKIFVELMEWARQVARGHEHAELDAIAARWQATSGDATGAEGEG